MKKKIFENSFVILLGLVLTSLVTWNASALDLKLAPKLSLSYDGKTEQVVEPTEGDEHDSSTFEFGLSLPIFFAVHPMFDVGPTLAFDYTSTDNGNNTVTGNLFGGGIAVRSELAPIFAIQGDFVYLMGSTDIEGENGNTVTADLSGFEFNIDFLLRGKLEKYKTWVEMGPFVGYRSMTSSLDIAGITTDTDTTDFKVGLMMQVLFSIGL